MINIEMWLGVLLSVNLLVTAFKHYWDEKTGGGLSSMEYHVVSELKIEKQNKDIQTDLYEQTEDIEKKFSAILDRKLYKNNKEILALIEDLLKEYKNNED